MGSQHKKKKGTDDTRIIIADIKRDADQDFTQAALQPTYEGNAYIVQSRSMIDFVNVTESIDPSQTAGGVIDTIPPGQVTGLSATAASDTTISLNWTANTEPDMDHYDVYRGTVTGFTVTLGVTVPVGSPTTNSYLDTGRTASTTYYYKVGAVDYSGNRGAVSLQASATTQAPLPPGTAPPPSDFAVVTNPASPSDQAIMNWTDVSFSPAVTGYNPQWSTNPSTFVPGFEYTNIAPGSGSGGVAVISLTPNTVYYFRIRSINSAGSGAWSATKSITTAP